MKVISDLDKSSVGGAMEMNASVERARREWEHSTWRKQCRQLVQGVSL